MRARMCVCVCVCVCVWVCPVGAALHCLPISSALLDHDLAAGVNGRLQGYVHIDVYACAGMHVSICVLVRHSQAHVVSAGGCSGLCHAHPRALEAWRL